MMGVSVSLCPKCKIGFLRLMGEIASERERRRYGELM